MAYYLRITNKNKGKYLQIYETFRVKETKTVKAKCYESLGYEGDLKTEEINNPIEHYKKYVEQLNAEKELKKLISKTEKITDENKTVNIGTSLVKGIFKTLRLEEIFKAFGIIFNRRFSHYEIFRDLVCARIFEPKSKLYTYSEILPIVNPHFDYSLDDVYSFLEDFGSRYESIIELINASLSKKYERNTSISFFDCTNFYFEIDKSDELRAKGPSKENRKEPIIGMGLLLDRNCMPITMQMYPGNQSEIPMLKKCIDSARKQKIIVNRTIRVADKGLNCGNNIYEALMNKDGYIFSKSVIKLSEKEKVWVDLENGYTETYENGILVFKIKSCIDEFTYEHTDENKKKNPFKSKEKRVVYWSKKLYDKKMLELYKLEVKVKNLSLSKAKKEKYNAYASYIDFVGLDKNGEITEKTIIKINQEKLNRDRKYAGYNMIVTSEINASDNDIYDIYHHLWRIEETFRILKTNLDARPVYVQKESTIFGHFLVCYTSILMVRILQFLVYKNEIKSNELIEFMKTFNVYKIDDDLYINQLKPKNYLEKIKNNFSPIIDNAKFRNKEINELLDCSIDLKSTTK